MCSWVLIFASDNHWGEGDNFQEQRKRSWLYANPLSQMEFGEQGVFLKMLGKVVI